MARRRIIFTKNGRRIGQKTKINSKIIFKKHFKVPQLFWILRLFIRCFRSFRNERKQRMNRRRIQNNCGTLKCFLKIIFELIFVFWPIRRPFFVKIIRRLAILIPHPTISPATNCSTGSPPINKDSSAHNLPSLRYEKVFDSSFGVFCLLAENPKSTKLKIEFFLNFWNSFWLNIYYIILAWTKKEQSFVKIFLCKKLDFNYLSDFPPPPKFVFILLFHI